MRGVEKNGSGTLGACLELSVCATDDEHRQPEHCNRRAPVWNTSRRSTGCRVRNQGAGDQPERIAADPNHLVRDFTVLVDIDQCVAGKETAKDSKTFVNAAASEILFAQIDLNSLFPQICIVEEKGDSRRNHVLGGRAKPISVNVEFAVINLIVPTQGLVDDLMIGIDCSLGLGDSKKAEDS